MIPQLNDQVNSGIQLVDAFIYEPSYLLPYFQVSKFFRDVVAAKRSENRGTLTNKGTLYAVG